MNGSICKCFFVGLTLIGSSKVIAADITALDGLGYQSASTVIDARLDESIVSGSVLLDQMDRIKLDVDDKSELYGRRHRFGLNLNWRAFPRMDLAVGMRQIHDVRFHFDSENSDATQKRGYNYSLASRFQLLDSKHLALAMVPYIEPESGGQGSFSIASKSRAGLILAKDLNFGPWTLSNNAGYRYRPNEVYGSYHLANDYHFASRLGLHINPLTLQGEIVERTIYIMPSLDRFPDFRRHVSQYHRLRVAIDFDGIECSVFWGRGVRDKVFGVGGPAIGLAIGWQLHEKTFGKRSSQRGESRYIDQGDYDLEPSKEISPASSPDVWDYDNLSDDQDPAVKPDSHQGNRPVIILSPEKEPADKTPSEGLAPGHERLDEIEHKLQEMQLIDTVAKAHSPRQREVEELRIGGEQIKILGEVEKDMERNRAFQRLRHNKLHGELSQRATAPEKKAVESSPELLDRLDQDKPELPNVYPLEDAAGDRAEP